MNTRRWIMWGVLTAFAFLNIILQDDPDPYIAGALVVAAMMKDEKDES